MLNKKIILMIFLASILSLSIVSAADSNCSDIVNIKDTTDEQTNFEHNSILLEENNLNNPIGTFSELSNLIGNTSEGSTLELYMDYKYVDGSKEGIQINKSITINGNGHTLDGLKKSRIFNVDADEITLINITLMNGNAADKGGAILGNNFHIINSNMINNTAKEGGAIYSNDFITIMNSNFINNSALRNGGSIYSNKGTVSSVNSRFINNTAGDSGAAIFTYYGALSSANSTFINNRADVNGGAIEIYSTVSKEVTIINSSFINNYAGEGGGAAYLKNGNVINSSFIENTAFSGGAISGDATVINSNFTNNKASYIGGAIQGQTSVVKSNFIKNTAYYGGAISTQVNYSSTDSNFINNSAYHGGAIYSNFDTLYIMNSSIIENNASEYGGAIYSEYSNITIINSNLINNKAKANITFYNLSSRIVIINSKIIETNIMSINITANDINYGEKLIVSVTLPSDVTRRAIVTVDNQSKYVTLKNGSGIVKFSDLSAGKHMITAFYNGDEKYSKMSNNLSINVNNNSFIKISANDISYGKELIINVTLPHDVTRRAIITVDNQSKYVTLKKGTGIIKFANLTTGKHNIIASYNGDEKYGKSSLNLSVNVNRSFADLNVIVKPVSYGEQLVVNVSLNNDVTRRAIVTIGNESKLVSLKNGEGSVKFSDLSAGIHNIQVSYNGDSNYLKSSINTTVKVNKAIPDLQIFTENITSESVDILIKTPHELSRRVNLTIFNQSTLVKITNGMKKVKFTGLNPGTYDIKLSYAGDNNYKSTTLSANVEIKKI